ncbi:uncharacterized protein LOC114941093 [Nylanderia fulva]|uniref:uncharacterized protein LOC114941093 n=1 Tax=Nylanderia fulva TaxID=613905 RepID=UPI0010FBA390|nr:uncharacterized protein LOC114941093 [Nylanderia fulva]
MDTRTVRMFSIVLYIFALWLKNDIIVLSYQIDDVTLKFIDDTMPILFPPSRITLHLCINHDDTIKLSKKLSSLYLMHDIYNNVIPDFNKKIYDDLKHQNLYVLDLDCNDATKILQQVNVNKMFVAPMRWLLLQDRRTLIDNDNNITLISMYDNSISEIFEDLAVYPDSDVVLAKRFDGNFLQLTSVYRPSPQRGVIWEDRGNWTVKNGLRMKTFDVASRRRRNLQKTTLTSAIVVYNPDTLNHLTDYQNPHIDPVTKVTYMWVTYLINRMNATINFTIVDDCGKRLENGSFLGMTGMLDRHEIDIGGTAMYMVTDRIDQVQYVPLNVHMRTVFVFRQPLLSTMKNIFILPFAKNVWIAIAIFLLVVFCSLYLSMKWEYYRNTMKKSSVTWKDTHIGNPTLGEDFLILLGACAQQGYSYEPYRFAARTITLMLLIASLSLYAAYTANIVALLQSPSDSINTLSDLFYSPLTLSVHDLPFYHYMLQDYVGSSDLLRKAILEEKIEPKGHKPNYVTVEEGVNRMKNESFAFHASNTRIYYYMQQTYQESEKCGLTEIDYMGVIPSHLVLPKQSPYLEIIKNGCLKLREYGLKYRDEYRLFTKKPKCTNPANFISVGFTECRFVILVMSYGFLITLIVFVLELVWNKIQNKFTIEETVPFVKENEDLEITEYKTVRMFKLLCIFALLLGNDMIAFSHHIDDVILKFIVDTMPILFPPSRISLHSCITHDDTIKLSRKLSSHYLMHSIHNNVITEFDTRIYDDLEHRNLYVLDMDCNYSLDFLRKVDLNRMFVAPMRWLLLQDQRTLNDNDDNATHNLTFTYDNSITEIFEDLAVYPDSDVVFAKRLNGDFVQLTSVYRPSPQRGVIWEDRGNWTVENGLRMKTFDVASARRRNLQQTTLKTTVVLTNPKSVNYLDNYEDPQKDPAARANLNWVRHIVNRMNATLNVTVEISTHWGKVFKNGTSNGLVGMLIRREIDIGGIHMPFLYDRLDKVKYINLHTNLGMRFVFRQPLLSSVKNIFILPFERNVWIAIAVFLLVVFCFLYISMKWEYYRNTMKKSAATWKDTHIGNPTLGEDFLILLGACAQQGYSYEPYRFSTRIITLMLLVASLSLYTAYTANIVALLQSPANSIKTVSDLLHSHLILGAQDYIFVHYLFESYQDPVRKAILEKKIEPKGHKANWMDVVDATPRIRNESFAFHGVQTRIYRIIEETFQEYEKCGITEIDYVNEVAYLAVPKQSPYLEIIKNGAMKLREYGLKFRDEYRLFTRKPKCTNPANFISVGFTECRFVILVMSYGFLITLIVFALELVWHKIRNKFTQKETVLIVKKNEDLEITEYID